MGARPRSPASRPEERMPQRVASVEERLRKTLGPGLLTQEPLRHHTTFRIGGPADFYFAARTSDQMVEALRTAHALDVPVFLLGGSAPSEPPLRCRSPFSMLDRNAWLSHFQVSFSPCFTRA